MNAERLLAHYGRISDAPDTIARLRGFVLDLAVRGKLMPQDPNDEPASELLKRIEKERDGKLRKDVPVLVGEEELTGLPNGWCAVPLIALGTWANGAGFPKSEQGSSEGPFMFLKVSDMNLPGNEKFITVANNFIDGRAAQRMRAKIHPPGTIIFPKIGGAIATNKRRILTIGAAIDNNCLGITFSREIDTEWAYLLLTSLDFTQYQAGTALPALQQGTLEKIPVGLPSLAEQHRIVAKANELMALCDRLEAARAGREAVRDRLAAASLARLNAPDPETFYDDARFALDALPALTTRADQIKQLRQTILNLAMRGELVPQDPNDEAASELLKRIAAEKHRLSNTSSRREDPKNDPSNLSVAAYDLPNGWDWVRLEEITEIGTGLTPSKGKREYYDGGDIPWINSAATADDVIGEAQHFVTERAVKECRLKMYPAGSLVVALYGQGKTRGQVAELGISATVNQACAVIQWLPSFREIKGFVRLVLEQQYDSMREQAAGGPQPNLNLGKIRERTFGFPPLAEQHRIVVKVDDLMALCDQLEASLANADETRRRLLDALLADALEHRVVPAMQAA